MRHVSDGELHAYLDGALDLLPQARGEEVRDHLASCPVCEERLQDERNIRQKAQALLERTALEKVEPFPFEELRARAEASGSPPGLEPEQERVQGRFRGPLKGLPLAWAATVAVALGVGWMGGEVWRSLPTEDARVFSGPPTDAQPALVSPELETGDRQTASGRPEGSADPGSGELRVRESVLPSAVEALGAPAADPGGARLERSLQPPRFSTVDPEPLDTERTPPDHFLAVPGLELLSVEWEEWIPGERSLHIRQLLPVGDTLELRYLGMLMGTDPALGSRDPEELEKRAEGLFEHTPFPRVMEASLPPGWNQVVMKKGRMWLVARAPVSESHLRALLRSLR